MSEYIYLTISFRSPLKSNYRKWWVLPFIFLINFTY
jgi:hypothetical protein